MNFSIFIIERQIYNQLNTRNLDKTLEFLEFETIEAKHIDYEKVIEEDRRQQYINNELTGSKRSD